MSYTQIYYHIIIRTKNSEKSISQHNVAELYKYIWGIIKNKKCQLYRINGIEDHIHLFISLHPTIALSNFVKDIKLATNQWMKSHDDFKKFKGWSERYAAFTYSNRDKNMIINYIINQQEHHRKESFKEEVIRIFREENVKLDERFFL
jgi:REP element-mobilizing transposase RayT